MKPKYQILAIFQSMSIMSSPDSNNLMSLATYYKSDKWNSHSYAQHYQKHFESLRFEKLNILEIGVGGLSDPNSGGASLKMWRDFFPNSVIYGIDIYDKSGLEEERIKIFQGSQDDAIFLENIVEQVGGFNIIIDDGCHINSYVIKSFKTLFPLLRDGGIYVVEDTQTSYWKMFGGNSDDLNSVTTTMGLFKSLVDCLNHEEFDRPGYVPSYFDKNLIEIHFYHNIVFFYKGENNEGSNIVENNVLPENHPLIVLDNIKPSNS
ncbi:MAG: hypothetical protein AB4057_19095 [Crocosphaera sp.]